MSGEAWLSFEMMNWGPIQKKMRQLTAHLEDIRPLALALDPFVYQHFREWFDSQGEGTWEPLSNEYAAWKAANYPGAPILVASGDLRRSLVDQGSKGNVRRIERDSAEWGTDIFYAKFHQMGTGTRNSGDGRGNMPQRLLISHSDSFRKRWLSVCRQWLKINTRSIQ